MDPKNKYQNRSDDKETQYIPIPETIRKRSDQYDTQKLSTEELRQRIRQEENEKSRQSAAKAEQYKRANRSNQSNYSSQNSGYSRGYEYDPQQVPPPRNSGGYYNRQPNNQPYSQNSQRNQNYRSSPPPNRYSAPPQRSPQQHSAPPRNNYYNQKGKQNYSRKRSRPLWKRVIKSILVFIIAIFVIYSAIALIGIFRTNITATASRERTEDALNSSSVDNILVIGTDSRDIETDTGRSDSIILLSINSKNNTIYMTSFLRDVYVYINDTYGNAKLNAAYSYGGAELLMDTIESNYRIRIDDYVIISFEACAAVIDAVGGVEVTLSDDEANALNEILISEVNELMGDGRNDDLLESGGTYKLNGKQALSYSRIRYVGNADFERTSRQREILSSAMKKACKNPIAICNIFFNALPEVTTNIQGLSLYGYAIKAPFMIMSYDIKQQQIPTDDSFYSDYRDGEDVLITDFTQNNTKLLETVYEGVFD